jgi:hypothetical protein
VPVAERIGLEAEGLNGPADTPLLGNWSDRLAPVFRFVPEAGMIGSWEGCVTTPWTSVHHVAVTFRADGTYSAVTTESLDDSSGPAFYYGTDEDSPEKLYRVNDLQDSGKGGGEIDVHFWPGNSVRDELRNTKLIGDKLEFELFHFHVYGPVTVRLICT